MPNFKTPVDQEVIVKPGDSPIQVEGLTDFYDTPSAGVSNTKPVITGGIAQTGTPNTYSQGTVVPIWLDPRGTVQVNYVSGLLANVNVNAYAASLIIKNAPGVLKMLNGWSTRLTPQWILLFDSAVLPVDGAVPVAGMIVNPNQNFSFDYGVDGRAFQNGIVVCNSITGPTKTIGAADCWFDAQINS